MPPTKLPLEHHIVRYVPWARLRKDDDDPEKVIGVLGAAFALRPQEDYLSTTWVEYFPGEGRAKVHGAIRAIRASKLKPGGKSGFAIANVQRVTEAAGGRGHKIRVLHEPKDDNKAHVAVRRWPPDDMEFFELLAADTWSCLVFNKEDDIPAGAEPAPDRPDWSAPADQGRPLQP